MKKFLIIALFTTILTACPRYDYNYPQIQILPKYLIILDENGNDLIAKHHYARNLDTTAYTNINIETFSVPRSMYDYTISLNGNAISQIKLKYMYEPVYPRYTDEGKYMTVRSDFKLFLEYDDFDKYYEQTENKQEGTVVYNLSFPMLFGDGREVVMEMYWKVHEVAESATTLGGHELIIEKVLINGEIPEYYSY